MTLNTDLEGTCVLVTGGSRGIGKVIVKSFLAQGANVSYCARNTTGTEFRDCKDSTSPARAVGKAVDVGSQEEITGWVKETAELFGRIDTVVANASPMHMEDGIEHWHDSFAVDIMGVVNLIKASIPYLEKSTNPSIVIISSFMAREFYRSPPAPYGPFKAAQLQHIQELSHFYGPKGIRVNAVSPGPILCEGGPWDKYSKEIPEWVEEQRMKVALRRLGGPQEVANAVIFLASPLSSYIAGTNLLVDGGIHVATQF